MINNTERKPLTAHDVWALGRIVDACAKGRPVWRVDADYDNRLTGVARHTVHDAETAAFLTDRDDIRDSYLRVSGLFEYFWPVSELVTDLIAGRFGIEDE